MHELSFDFLVEISLNLETFKALLLFSSALSSSYLRLLFSSYQIGIRDMIMKHYSQRTVHRALFTLLLFTLLLFIGVLFLELV